MKHLLLVILVFTKINCLAQLYEKSYQTGNIALQANKGIISRDGNILFYGNASSSFIAKNLSLIKLNANTGDTIWNKTIHKNKINLSATYISESSFGGITLLADGQDSGSNNIHKIYKITLDTLGNTINTQVLNNGKSYASMYSTGLKELSNGSIITLGVSYDSLGIIIAKYDANGTNVFNKSLQLHNTAGLSGGHLYDVIQKNDAYFFIGNASFDGNSPDLLVVKSDTLGNIQWVKSSYSGLTATLYIVSAKFLKSSNPNLDFILGTGVSSALIQMDTSGTLLSFKNYEYSNSTSSILQPYFKNAFQKKNGNILFAGITDLQMNANIGTHVGRPFIFETDSLGNILWSKKYSVANDLNSNALIASDNAAAIYLGGSAYTQTSLSVNNFQSRAYLIKLDSAGNLGINACGLDTAYSLSIAPLTKTLRKESFSSYNSVAMDTCPSFQSRIPLSISNLGMGTALTISVSPGIICQGGQAFFTVTSVTNPGLNPTFNFYVNHALIQSSFSPNFSITTLNNGDSIQAEIISTANCVSPNNGLSGYIIAKIYPTQNPSITISASPSININAGTLVTFTASITNGGPSPYFNWKKNGTHVGGNNSVYITNSLSNGDTITCDVSSSTCAAKPIASSNELIISINPALSTIYLNKDKIEIESYPNPFEKDITIQCKNTKLKRVRIYNVQGSLIYSFENIDTDKYTLAELELKTGIYIIELATDSGYYFQKMLRH